MEDLMQSQDQVVPLEESLDLQVAALSALDLQVAVMEIEQDLELMQIIAQDFQAEGLFKDLVVLVVNVSRIL